KTASRAAKNPLPPKLAALVRESWWFALLGLTLYLALVLYTYSPSDPAWSRTGDASVIANAGGRIGAWIADVLLYVFGLSAYWWVAGCGALVWAAFGRIEQERESDRRSYVAALIGFVLLLVSSAGLEAIRLHSLQA